ncbi:hypothetical protein D3C83_251320 [compost metagenome]
MLGYVRLRGSGGPQRFDNALPHFRGRLAGECDREHLLGQIDAVEQSQQPLGQKFRLARSCRRLDDE